MKVYKALSAAALLMLVTACSTPKPQYPADISQHPISTIIVNKADRKMLLMSGEHAVREYKIDLGFAPVGDKKVQGDGKTPEGTYTINRRNPQSQFYLSLGISYPDHKDRLEAYALGKSPGGDIFIHGQSKWGRSGVDWTEGCIAVTDQEMKEIYAVVKNGTKVVINP